MANRYWVGGTGTWDATTTHWSATDGGVAGASAPTLNDDVFFTNLSSVLNAAYTVTMSTPTCRSITIDSPGAGNKVTIAGSGAMNVYGDMVLTGGTAGITWTYTGAITFAATGANSGTPSNQNLNVNGVKILGGITIGQTSAISRATLTLTGDLETSNSLTIYNNRFIANGKTVTLSGATQTINQGFVGDNAFYNLTRIGQNSTTSQITFNGDIDVTNTLTLTGFSAAVPDSILTNSLGRVAQISANSVVTQYTFFRDIKGAGSANWDLRSQAINYSGDLGGNVGITFTDSTDQHFTNVAGGSWSTASNWTSRIPLPQDNCIFDTAFTGSATITADLRYLGKNIDFSSATWGTSLTFTPSSNISIYGSLILKSGMVYTVTGNTLTIAGRGDFFINSNTVTIDCPITLNAPNGKYSLSNNLTTGSSRTLNVTLGEFDTNGYVLSTGVLTLGTGNAVSGLKAILDLKNETHLITGTSGTIISMTTASDSVSIIRSGNYTLKVTDTGASSVTIAIAKKVNNLWISRGTSTAAVAISQSGIYNDFKCDTNAAHQIQFTAGTVNCVTTFNVNGSSGKLRTIQSNTSGSKATLLCKTGTINCNYITSTDLLVGGGATWNAGVNSTFSTGNYFGNGFGWSDAPNSVKYRYWVNTAGGSWSTLGNWSTSSGGAGGSSVPIGEIVVLDANSGSNTVNMSSGAITCGDLICTGFTGTLSNTFGATQTVNIAGSVTFPSSMTYSDIYENAITFSGSGTSKTINFGNKYIPGNITFSGVDSTGSNLMFLNGFGDIWGLSNNLDCGGISKFTVNLTSGTLNTNNYNIKTGTFSSVGATARALNMGSSTFELYHNTSPWTVSGSFFNLNSGTSTIKITDKLSSGITFTGGGLTYNSLWYYSPKDSQITISGNNTFNEIKIDSYGTSKTIRMPFSQINSVSQITNTQLSGNNTLIQSSNGNELALINSPSGYISEDYLIVSSTKFLGTGYVGTHSVNTSIGNTFNFIFNSPTNYVSGTVTNSGVGVSGAKLRLIEQATDIEVGTTTTDGSGNYIFYADPTKVYHVCVEYESGGTKYNAKSLWNITPF